MKLPISSALWAVMATLGATPSIHAATPDATGTCRLATAAAVSSALHVSIVRVEPGPEEPSVCEYSVKGKPSSAATDHGIAMVGAMSGQPMDPAAQKMLQGFGQAVLGGQDADGPNKVRHAGETPVLVIDVHTGDASEMALNRSSLGFMQPATPISGLGDEAFSTSQSMMFVRKSGKILRIVYTGCPCTSKDVEPLARQIAAAL